MRSSDIDPDTELVVHSNDDRYGQRRPLGAGGMGEVALCHDRMTGRDVAMKVALPEHEQDPELRALFVREARVQAQLEHPAIVPVYDVGRDSSGRTFFTMRCLRGVTLEEVIESIRNGDVETERRYTRHILLAAFVRACLTIEYAHEQGIVHHDLKPSNVMFGRHGEVYVLDWGLAKVRGRDAALEDSSPSLRGTLRYMAPEQLRGGATDARSDVYSLGAILFEMLTLEPLQASTTVTGILASAVKGVEARPSIRAPHREVAPELERACVRATAVDPANRHGSARELAEAVEAYLSGDRDLALRRDLAKAHLDRAREAMRDGAGGPVDAPERRSTALREVGRALALTPDDPPALAFLVGLLTDPPKTPIAVVEQRLLLASRQSHRAILPRAAVFYAVLPSLLIPLSMALGVREPFLALTPLVCWLFAAAASLLAWRFSDKIPVIYPVVTMAAAAGLATVSFLYGPLILSAPIAVVTVMGTALHTPKRNRWLLITMIALAMSIPTLLAAFDRHHVRHAIVDGSLLISNGALTFTSASFVLIGVMNLAFVVVGGLFVGMYQDNLRELQRKAELQAWQLEQLVPSEAALEMKR